MSDVFNCPPVCNKCFQCHPIGENCKSSRSPAGYVANVHDEFDRLLEKLDGVNSWTAAERAAFFCFFCHGWYGRANEAAYQAT
jgi:hypothetical protein